MQGRVGGLGFRGFEHLSSPDTPSASAASMSIQNADIGLSEKSWPLLPTTGT